MLITLVIFQLVVDACLVSLLFWVWWQYQAKTSQASPDSAFEIQFKELERQLAETKLLVDKQLQEMSELYLKTSKLLNSGMISDGLLSDSVEENEIKEALKAPKESKEIPSLQQLEMTNRRLKMDTSFDLKTLLKGQLT
jgi:hypothetical protein